MSDTDLNAKVAELLGWATPEPGVWVHPDDIEDWRLRPKESARLLESDIPPDYLADPWPVLKVLGEMTGHVMEIEFGNGLFAVDLWAGEEIGISEHGPTLAHAICRAFIAAKGAGE